MRRYLVWRDLVTAGGAFLLPLFRHRPGARFLVGILGCGTLVRLKGCSHVLPDKTSDSLGFVESGGHVDTKMVTSYRGRSTR